MAIEVFSRQEVKYLLSNEDKEALLQIIGEYMDSDKFNKGGKPYSICNLYLDTTSDELIRKSLEKPVYKEKIRLRSYGTADLEDTVFLESKKKFDHVVYKRRTSFKLKDVYRYFEDRTIPDDPKINRQVLKEIDYIMNMYDLSPRVFISYDRLAFFEKNNSDFRLTIDRNIQTRRNDLKLEIPASGTQLLPEGTWLMEAKAFKAFPLWFVKFLSSRKIFNTSFSKYGTEYKMFAESNKNAVKEEN